MNIANVGPSALCTSAYAMSFFLPIILKENMGFSVGEAQYLSAPPYALAAGVMMGMAWIGDKYHIRGPLLLGNCLLGIIGLPLLVSNFFRCPAMEFLANHYQPGLRGFGRSSILWMFPHVCQCPRRHPDLHGLPSYQHPWPLEAGFLLRDLGWFWWFWRYCGFFGIPLSGSSHIPSRCIRMPCMQHSHHHHCDGEQRVFPEGEQESRQG